jgi:hypothetical protein
VPERRDRGHVAGPEQSVWLGVDRQLAAVAARLIRDPADVHHRVNGPVDKLRGPWERATTDEVFEHVENAGGDAGAKLRRLFPLASSGVVAVDLAVRDWARREPAVAERLRRIDNRRMDYLRVQFSALCADADDVETRSMLYYSLMIGNRFIAADHGARSRADVLEMTLRHLGAW